MFSSVARLRLLPATLLLFTASLVSAHTESLFASSVSYCSPPESILVQQLDLTYLPSNNSISFNVSAASVESNLNVSVNIFVNVYGAHPINLTVDICNILSGALCPLPEYNFVGAESLQLPDSVDISSFVPAIAFKIPDLEAYAQITLIETSTSATKACLQITVANGWSMHQPAVSWATGGVAFLALASAAWQSLVPESLLAPFRLLDLLGIYQIIAFSALLDLNYPVVYRAFALNFSWAIGLFFQSDSSLQNSIDHMRNLTGGDVSDSSDGDAVALVNRKLSPYNDVATDFVSSISSRSLSAADFIESLLPTNFEPSKLLATSANSLVSTPSVDETVQIVTSDSDNVLDAGIPIYANAAGIDTANAFMTVFFVTLILFAIALGLLAIVFGILLILTRKGPNSPVWARNIRGRYPIIVRQWGLRVLLVCLTPLIIFAFYQWTLDDSWLSILISAISFVAVMAAMAWISWKVFITARRSGPDSLSHEVPEHEPLFGHHRIARWWFFFIPLAALFVRSLLIAFAKDSGTAQVVFFIIIDFFVFVSLCVLKPNRTRRADVLTIFLALIRLVVSGLLIAFLESLDVAAIPRVAIGIVIAVIWSVTIVIMFINIVWNLGIRRLWNARRFRNLDSRSPSPSREKTENSAERGGLYEEKQEETSPTSHNDNIPIPPAPQLPRMSELLPPSSATLTETSYGNEIPSRFAEHDSAPYDDSNNRRPASQETHSAYSYVEMPPSPVHSPHARDSYFPPIQEGNAY